MIKVSNLSFSYGGKDIFNDTSFIVPQNQIVGVVGPNGAGKTTLFELFTGEKDPDSGKIEVLGEIGLVPQEIKHDPLMENSKSTRDYLNKNANKQDFELRKVLSGLEMEELSLDEPPQNLSGGQKTKLALAKALISEPEVLLLDEPTNFMDVSGKKWVTNFLSNYPKTLMIVSHDLNLLRNIDRILYINIQTKKVEEYKGDYSQFRKLQAQRAALLRRQYIAKKKHIKKMEESAKKIFLNVKSRVQLEKRIIKEKQNLPDIPKEIRNISVSFPTPSRPSEIPLKAVDVCKSYPNVEVLKNITFSIRRGEKVALIGKNGVGKSTLLKILVDIIDPDSGQVIYGDNLKLGYYSQEFETFDFEERVLEMAQRKCDLDESKLRALLARFLFDRNKILQKIGTLSGGEKTRLAIALLVMYNYNLLILDEPTTYLDPMSQRLILEALKEYKGAMIIVSHNPQFISELSPGRVIILPSGKVDFWFDEYLPKVSET